MYIAHTHITGRDKYNGCKVVCKETRTLFGMFEKW